MATRKARNRERAAEEFARARRPAIVRSSRQLDESECQRIWSGLEARWHMKAWGWYPTTDRAHSRAKARTGVYSSAQFAATAFDPGEDGQACEPLREALVTRGVARIYELREDVDFSHEIDAEAIEVICWGGQEGVWTDDTFDWVIYVDHEDAVWVAGDCLMSDLVAVWPAWRSSLYRDPN